MVMDMAVRKYYVSFALDRPMKFEGLVNDVVDTEVGANSYFQQLAVGASSIVMLTTVY
jgi:hypothetical protein